MKTYTVDVGSVVDWDTFHDVFSKALGFPDYYGRNMDAWIDCMTDIVDIGEGISLVLDNASSLKSNHPEALEAINECTAFVNYRSLEAGEEPRIALTYNI